MPSIMILHRRIHMALAEFRSLQGSLVWISFWHLVYWGDSYTLHLGKQPSEKWVCPKQRKPRITSVPSAVSEWISCRFKIHEKKKDQKNDLQPEVIAQLGISWKILLLHAHKYMKNECICVWMQKAEHCRMQSTVYGQKSVTLIPE